ncbi:MAG TPA: helix-turn-helix domain-containing protein [Ktedonobacterales bacterium]
MSTPTRREQQAEQRRNQLIDTALALFAERGFERTTIKDLAETAGVAQGLVYHYFASKDELLQAVIARHNPLPQLRAMLEVAHEVPAAQLLPQLMLGAHAIFLEKQPLLHVGLRELLVKTPVRAQVFELQRQGIGLLARYLAARVAAGELRPQNTEVTARMVLSGVMLLFLTETPPEPYIQEFLATLWQGIAAS